MATIIMNGVPDKVKEQLRETAKSKGMTMTGYIMHLIENDKEKK